MDRKVIAVGVFLLGAAAVGGLLATGPDGADPVTAPPVEETEQPVDNGTDGSNESSLQTFDNATQFRAYVARGSTSSYLFQVRTTTTVETDDIRVDTTADAPSQASESGGGSGGGAGPRVAETNVQTSGLDEPDLVKTDGRHFYYATRERHVGVRDSGGDGYHRESTYVVDADDPAVPEKIGQLNTSGQLLLVGDTLVVLRADEVVGYDVGTPGDPERVWSRALNGSVVSARATDGQVYLVVRSDVTRSTECPFTPFGNGTVECDDIHRPDGQIPVDATYFALSVTPETGAVDDRVAFVGTRDRSVVYMSQNALYVTYTEPIDRGELYAQVVESYDETPPHVEQRVEEIQSYDLSQRATTIEVQRAYRGWLQSLDGERAQRVRENFTAYAESYAANNSRKFVTTGVVRVGVDGADLTVESVGTVPGRPLNQFSLDEHNGTLRVATTIPGVSGTESQNDLYTLDANSLDRLGAVQGMGENQEIFAVRYVDETAYLVTFRRVDPFHVVNISDPSDPVERGELELPGFSRYLHPVDEDHVLGIGREGGRVKAVLFDVANESNPTIADSKRFDRSWSEVSQTHHAFLMDRRHGVFFLPTGEDGLVVDYTDERLELTTTVDVRDPTRARYVGDSLYVFGSHEIAVVNEQNWERTATLDLDG